MSKARDDIAAVMSEIPDLGDFGIGVFNQRKLTAEVRAERLEAERERLLRSEDSFLLACEWLSRLEKRKTINNGHTSYGLKHLAEKSIGYVTNGVFIAAAVHCGFPYRIRPGSPNVEFGISEKSLKAVRREYYEKIGKRGEG